MANTKSTVGGPTPTSKKRRRAGLRQWMTRAAARVNKLPIPTFGPWTRLIGLAGLGLAVMFLGLEMAVLIRAVRTSDALNPFNDDVIITLPTVAPPNLAFLTTPLPGWDGGDRVTVLLMGADSRAGEQIAQPRTDTMMILQLDPTNKRASVLSIPRDLYVEVPGYGLQRINTAYVLGGGPLAVQTVEYNLGVRIDHYVLVRFQVLIAIVDEIGGITVNLPYAINDPTFPDLAYGFDPLYLPAGEQTLNGYDALRLARTRHGDSDYERARRQQMVLFAIRDKVTSLDMLPTLIQRAPALYDALSQNITTDMSLEQMTRLATSAVEVEREDIRSEVIDSRYVIGYTTPQGASVLIPNRSNIGELIGYTFWLEE